ncbi:S-adenosyl-L-homocysteine hydrolase, NAD binding domain [Sesbania bispinosa]|nr:S-adenosyl-L-homocysteine hydrolase, NAD binding domain [Sesbania bispinosa]
MVFSAPPASDTEFHRGLEMEALEGSKSYVSLPVSPNQKLTTQIKFPQVSSSSIAATTITSLSSASSAIGLSSAATIAVNSSVFGSAFGALAPSSALLSASLQPKIYPHSVSFPFTNLFFGADICKGSTTKLEWNPSPEPFHFGSFGSLDLHREEEDASTSEDEDTGIVQVTPIIRLEEVALSTGEEDDEPTLDLKTKLHRFDKDENHWKEQRVCTVKILNTKVVWDSVSDLNKSSDVENVSGLDHCIWISSELKELNDDCKHFESYMQSLSNVIVGNYIAWQLFDEMVVRDIMSWSSTTTAYFYVACLYNASLLENLSVEDWWWWWKALFTLGSAALYVILYSIIDVMIAGKVVVVYGYGDVSKGCFAVLKQVVARIIVDCMRLAIKLLISGEKKICDQVFDGVDSLRTQCFAEVTASSVSMLLSFGKAIAKRKRSPEKLFVLLDMYERELQPRIERLFESKACTEMWEVDFKLIGEANRMLSDQANRSLYDIKLKGFVRIAAPKTSSTHLNEILKFKDSLNEWDSMVGDGDCGSTMYNGAKAILEDVKNYPLNDAAETVSEIGSLIRRAMGGTSGIKVLYLFRDMLRQGACQQNEFIFGSVFSAYSSLLEPSYGRQIHGLCDHFMPVHSIVYSRLEGYIC